MARNTQHAGGDRALSSVRCAYSLRSSNAYVRESKAVEAIPYEECQQEKHRGLKSDQDLIVGMAFNDREDHPTEHQEVIAYGVKQAGCHKVHWHPHMVKEWWQRWLTPRPSSLVEIEQDIMFYTLNNHGGTESTGISEVCQQLQCVILQPIQAERPAPVSFTAISADNLPRLFIRSTERLCIETAPLQPASVQPSAPATAEFYPALIETQVSELAPAPASNVLTNRNNSRRGRKRTHALHLITQKERLAIHREFRKYGSHLVNAILHRHKEKSRASAAVIFTLPLAKVLDLLAPALGNSMLVGSCILVKQKDDDYPSGRATVERDVDNGIMCNIYSGTFRWHQVAAAYAVWQQAHDTFTAKKYPNKAKRQAAIKDYVYKIAAKVAANDKSLTASHLCGNKRCINRQHLVMESLGVNVNRNGCRGDNCRHTPKCIRPWNYDHGSQNAHRCCDHEMDTAQSLRAHHSE